ncbi:MAG: GyrI-like domain-containing protein [Spirochaetia bacterium]
MWERLFGKWFPSSNYEHALGPEMEVYYKGDSQKRRLLLRGLDTCHSKSINQSLALLS